MIVLDTKVVSEAMKPEPEATERNWLNEQAAETLYLSSVTLAELLYCSRALPDGKRRNLLSRTLDGLLEPFQGRILPFDVEAARHHAELAVAARAAGRSPDTRDALGHSQLDELVLVLGFGAVPGHELAHGQAALKLDSIHR